MSELKEHDITESLLPKEYNKDNIELIFYVSLYFIVRN